MNIKSTRDILRSSIWCEGNIDDSCWLVAGHSYFEASNLVVVTYESEIPRKARSIGAKNLDPDNFVRWIFAIFHTQCKFTTRNNTLANLHVCGKAQVAMAEPIQGFKYPDMPVV